MGTNKVLAGMVLVASMVTTPTQAQPVNLIFLGDSLTEGVPHLNGETDTYVFQVAQQFVGSTYVKLGYRGQTTDFLRQHLDSFLTTLSKKGYANVLVLWAGTNDCAVGPLDCVQPVYSNLVMIARAARAAGWKVVVVTLIARDNYFIDVAHQTAFPANQSGINALIRQSSEFDAVADPAQLLVNADDTTLYWDQCHLLPQGYKLVAGTVVSAIKSVLSLQ